ncbi:MAG: four helix bundle protein [Acidobacteriota bacterium]
MNGPDGYRWRIDKWRARRRRFFEIARGSALECAAVQDVLEVCGTISRAENADAKRLLDRIVAMLTKLGRRGYTVREGLNGDDSDKVDCDTDCDTDSDSD